MLKQKFAKEGWHAVGNEIRDYKGLIIGSSYCHLTSNMSKKEQLSNAKLMAASKEMSRNINSLILSITSHPDYISGCEDDEWHTLVSLAQSTLEKAN